MSGAAAKTPKTVIVTGGSQGIGAGTVNAFLERGYNVVASSRNITTVGRVRGVRRSSRWSTETLPKLQRRRRSAKPPMSKFGSIDALVNNAGIYFSKPFTDYTVDDLRSLVSVNIEGFLFITQLAIKQMLAQNTGGSIVNITTTHGGSPDRRNKLVRFR